MGGGDGNRFGGDLDGGNGGEEGGEWWLAGVGDVIGVGLPAKWDRRWWSGGAWLVGEMKEEGESEIKR